MLHPSYVELMEVVNDDAVIGEEPVVNSRYSIVCAAAKRARQLIDGQEPLIAEKNAYGRKPLSIAVDELSEGDIKILTSDEAKVEQEKLDELREKTKDLKELVKEKREKEAPQRASEKKEDSFALDTEDESAADAEEEMPEKSASDAEEKMPKKIASDAEEKMPKKSASDAEEDIGAKKP